jgi:HSP20 family protein
VSYYARERYYGRFRRSMNLPEGVDGARVSADFENGLLEVTVKGGADHPEPERIQIGSSVG